MAVEIQCNVREGRITLTLQAHPAGDDLQLLIIGGDRPHIGAVAVSCCQPSLKDAGKQAVTTSLITVPGHKEGPLAQQAAERVATATGRTVCVSCGIHLVAISKDEIRQVEQMVDRLLDDFLQRFGAA